MQTFKKELMKIESLDANHNRSKTPMTNKQDLEAAINRCFMDCDDSTEGKIKAVSAFLDQVDQWRDDHAKAYLEALDSNPDLSPAGFTSRNDLNPVG